MILVDSVECWHRGKTTIHCVKHRHIYLQIWVKAIRNKLGNCLVFGPVPCINSIIYEPHQIYLVVWFHLWPWGKLSQP